MLNAESPGTGQPIESRKLGFCQTEDLLSHGFKEPSNLRPLKASGLETAFKARYSRVCFCRNTSIEAPRKDLPVPHISRSRRPLRLLGLNRIPLILRRMQKMNQRLLSLPQLNNWPMLHTLIRLITFRGILRQCLLTRRLPLKFRTGIKHTNTLNPITPNTGRSGITSIRCIMQLQTARLLRSLHWRDPLYQVPSRNLSSTLLPPTAVRRLSPQLQIRTSTGAR